jgi:hypothetical protein
MKAAQEAAKAANTCKGKKNNIFQSYLKASVVKLVLFFIYLQRTGYFKLLLFRSTNTASPQVCPAIHFNLLSAKKSCQGFFSYYQGYFTTSLP